MKHLLLASAAMAALAACSAEAPAPEAPAEKPAETAAVETTQSEDERLIEFLDAAWEEGVSLSPEYQTYLGRKTNMDKWNDRSNEGADKFIAMTERHLIELQEQFNRDDLSEEGQLSYDLFVYSRQQTLRLDQYRDNQFAFSQFRGVHSGIPVTLANYHRIDTLEDAEAYIARVEKIDETLGQAMTVFETRAQAGNTLPEFSFPLLAGSAANVIKGAPFTEDGTSPILADFTKKVDQLEIEEAAKADLIARLETALMENVKPAYEDFIARVTAIGADIEGNYGLAGPQGDQRKDYYNELLRSYTTTDLSADEIHEIGLSEVARIQEEMRAIMAAGRILTATCRTSSILCGQMNSSIKSNTDEGS